MELQLQGTKGSQTISVDSVGKVLNVSSVIEPVPGNDVYMSIDKSIDLLEGQIRKVKTKKERLLKTANIEMPSVDTDIFAEGEVTKVKTFSPKPMTVEDVILEIKDSDKMFYVFNNSDTNETNVLFKLKDGNYGILEPEK